MKRRRYKTYKSYVEHQSKKTKGMVYGWNYAERVELFKKRFVGLREVVGSSERVVCLGARFGEEVVAFDELGYRAFGVDLVPRSFNVLKGDFNNLPFKGEAIDIVYMNALDHAFDIDLLCKSVHRILKYQRYFVVDTMLARKLGPYEVYHVEKFVDVVSELTKKYFELIKKVSGLEPIYKKQKDTQLVLRKVQ